MRRIPALLQLKLWVRDVLSALRWLILGCWKRSLQPGVRILLYHTVADLSASRDPWRMSVPPALFAAHLRWLRQEGYTFVSVAAVLDMVRGDRALPPKAVAVTFDDGFRDTLTRAYPLLRAYQVPATVFVVPGCLDAAAPFPWLDQSAGFDRPLSWNELRALVGDSLIAVGSHSWSHRRLSELSLDEQQDELERSKSALEARLGRPVAWLAYPYGHRGSFSEETVACLQRAGFVAAFANIMGMNRAGDSPWELKRTRIGWEDRLWRFRLKMAGAYDWIDG